MPPNMHTQGKSSSQYLPLPSTDPAPLLMSSSRLGVIQLLILVAGTTVPSLCTLPRHAYTAVASEIGELNGPKSCLVAALSR